MIDPPPIQAEVQIQKTEESGNEVSCASAMSESRSVSNTMKTPTTVNPS